MLIRTVAAAPTTWQPYADPALPAAGEGPQDVVTLSPEALACRPVDPVDPIAPVGPASDVAPATAEGLETAFAGMGQGLSVLGVLGGAAQLTRGCTEMADHPADGVPDLAKGALNLGAGVLGLTGAATAGMALCGASAIVDGVQSLSHDHPLVGAMKMAEGFGMVAALACPPLGAACGAAYLLTSVLA